MRTHCTACGGEYDTTMSNGMAYYHVCPPITCVDVTRLDGTRARVNVYKLAATDRVRVRRGDAERDVLAADRLPDDVLVDLVAVERPDKRDERPAPRADAPDAIVSEGAGAVAVVPSPDDKPLPVVL